MLRSLLIDSTPYDWWYTFISLWYYVHMTLIHILMIDMTIVIDDSSCVHMILLVYLRVISLDTHSDVFWYTFWCLLIHILMSFDTHSYHSDTHSEDRCDYWYWRFFLCKHESFCVHMILLVYTRVTSFDTHTDVFWYTCISLWYTFWWSICLLILMILLV